MKKLIALFFAVNVMACTQHQLPSSSPEPSLVAKNVIFLIGDGMGLAQVSKAMQLQEEPLNLERAAFIGLSKTSSSKQVITDSAAGATAFSIGEKTFNGAIGIDANGALKTTLLEILSVEGFSTGVIATSGITHATPASFYAHVDDRENYYAIADDMLNSSVTLFIGGSKEHFDKRTDEDKGTPDTRNLVEEMQAKGVTLVDSLSALSGVSGRVGFFTADDHPKSVAKGRDDYLPKSIAPSIAHLQKESDVGFFMMVEGSQIDWGGHLNELDYVMTELVDFDKAVGVAMDFAMKDGNTLVLITADHETGGLTLPTSDIESDDPYSEAGHAFSSQGHTSVMVPVYAFGKGAENFSGVYENTAVYQKILSALGK